MLSVLVVVSVEVVEAVSLIVFKMTDVCGIVVVAGTSAVVSMMLVVFAAMLFCIWQYFPR